jgi:hypothetical protein
MNCARHNAVSASHGLDLARASAAPSGADVEAVPELAADADREVGGEVGLAMMAPSLMEAARWAALR